MRASNHFVGAALADGQSSPRWLPPNDRRGHSGQGQRVAEPKKGYPRPPGGDRRHPSIPLGQTLRAKNNYREVKLARLCGVGRSRSRPPVGNIGDVVRWGSLTSRWPCVPYAPASGSFECAYREVRPRASSTLPLGRLYARRLEDALHVQVNDAHCSHSVPHDDRRSQPCDPRRPRQRR